MSNYKVQLPIKEPAPMQATTTADLDLLRAQRDQLKARFHKGADFLEALATQLGQDSREFDHWFAEWQKVDESYRQADDAYYAGLAESIGRPQMAANTSNHMERS